MKFLEKIVDFLYSSLLLLYWILLLISLQEKTTNIAENKKEEKTKVNEKIRLTKLIKSVYIFFYTGTEKTSYKIHISYISIYENQQSNCCCYFCHLKIICSKK